MNMNTAIIGTVFVDVKGFARDTYAPTGTNIGSVRFVHGGVGRNVCENFGNQGMSATFVSSIDYSSLGNEVRSRLDRLGVDLRHTLQYENGMGMWLAILDNGGNLVGSVSKQPDFSVLEEYLYEHAEEIVANADSVVLEIDLNERIAGHILNLTDKYNKPIYTVVGNMSVILQHPEYLRRVRCFICNEIEAGRLFNQDLSALNPSEMLRLLMQRIGEVGCKSMVITMGAQGAVYYDSELPEGGFCPAIPTEMVDSTGAGDAFFSGTVMALNQGCSLRKAVSTGARLASATLACDESCCKRLDNLFN